MWWSWCESIKKFDHKEGLAVKKMTTLIRFGAIYPWVMCVAILVYSVVLDINLFDLPEELREFTRLQDDRLANFGSTFDLTMAATLFFISILLWFQRIEGVWLFGISSIVNYVFQIYFDKVDIHTPTLALFSESTSICLAVSATFVWVIHKYGPAFSDDKPAERIF